MNRSLFGGSGIRLLRVHHRAVMGPDVSFNKSTSHSRLVLRRTNVDLVIGSRLIAATPLYVYLQLHSIAGSLQSSGSLFPQHTATGWLISTALAIWNGSSRQQSEGNRRTCDLFVCLRFDLKNRTVIAQHLQHAVTNRRRNLGDTNGGNLGNTRRTLASVSALVRHMAGCAILVAVAVRLSASFANRKHLGSGGGAAGWILRLHFENTSAVPGHTSGVPILSWLKF
jgi:hypothetical protein